jgi:Rrf2 family protein
MLELTKKADYALRLMVEIAASPDGNLTTHEVARREDIPYQFLRKVAQGLVAAGLLASSRGAGGGLSLAHPANTISLLEIVRAVDEPAMSRCLIDPSACTRRNRCVIYPVWRRLQRQMESAMDTVLLSDLADRHQAVLSQRNDTRPPSIQSERPPKETPIVPSPALQSKHTVEVTPEGRLS